MVDVQAVPSYKHQAFRTLLHSQGPCPLYFDWWVFYCLFGKNESYEKKVKVFSLWFKWQMTVTVVLIILHFLQEQRAIVWSTSETGNWITRAITITIHNVHRYKIDLHAFVANSCRSVFRLTKPDRLMHRARERVESIVSAHQIKVIPHLHICNNRNNNKLASLEATLVWNYDPPTQRVTDGSEV